MVSALNFKWRVVWYHLETGVSLKLFAILLVSRFRRGRCATGARASLTRLPLDRVVEMSRRSRTFRINDRGCRRIFIPLPPSHEDRIPERHDVTRRKEAAERKTFDIAFLRGPVPPQRGAGSINRISGRSLIIHLCMPVHRMANPRKSLIFLIFRENPISATSFLPLLSLKRRRKLLRKDNEPKDRTNGRSVRYSTLYCCEGSCRGREFLAEQRKLLRAKKKTEHN